MSFRKNRVQEKMEEILGVNNLGEWKNNKENLKNYELSEQDVEEFNFLLKKEAFDFYFMGLLSFSEGVHSVKRKLFSWATVKLYYSLYYLIRPSFAVNNYGIIRNGGLFLLKNEIGSKAIAKSNKKKYGSTHQGAINYYIDCFKSTDILQSNKIEDETSYHWYIDKREIINYRSREFKEPECLKFWENFKNRNVKIEINKYINDEQFIFCFQEDHAILALPTKKIFLVLKELMTKYNSTGLNDEKKDAIRELLKNELGFNELYEKLISNNI